MKTRRLKLSFNKEEFNRSSLKLGCSGISTPLITDKQIKENYNLGSVRESFGFFGSSGDPNKFYPGLNIPEDVIPKPEDFIRVPFRLLSATVVGAGSWKATDFSDERVLKASLKKVDKKPIFTEHEQEMLNWVGIVEGTSWGVKSGDVPGGINGILAIDAKTNPKIARGVLIGAIFSNSVTVEFDWKPSHTFSDMYEFDNLVGTYHEDGTMIRRIVTKIHDYHETSLVWLGADPYAKLIGDDGKLVNIDTASTYKLEKEDIKTTYTENKSYSIPMSLDKNIISLSKRKKQIELKPEDMDKELKLALQKLLGLKDTDEVKVENLSKLALVDDKQKVKSENFGKLQAVNEKGENIDTPETIEKESFVMVDKSQFEGLVTTNTELAKFKADVNEKIPTEEGEILLDKLGSLSAEAENGKTLIEAKRVECKRLYGLSVDQKVDKTITEMIENADPKQLEALITQYSGKATGKFTGTCKSCGSKEFEFRSTETGEDDPEAENQDSASFQDLMEKYDKPSMISGK